MSLLSRNYLSKRNRIIPPAGRQTVTWTLVRATSTNVTIANCEKRPINSRADRFDGVEIPTDGFIVVMSEGDMLAPLSDASLSTSLVPEVGDRITLADGTVCDIEDVKREIVGTRHKCLCQPHRTIS